MARLLVVDDDPMVRELLVTVLTDGGHDVKVAGNGDDALRALQAERFAVVVMDRNMPRMSGLELLVLMRKDPALKSVKVVMCTGAGMLADAEDALKAGADDYVVKPLDIARLLEKVARLAAKAATEPPPPPKPAPGIMGAISGLFKPKP